MTMNTKFDEYLEFPCSFSFKVLGIKEETLADRVIAEIQKTVPGDYTPHLKPSSKGTYVSVTVNTTVSSKEQIEFLYAELAKLDGVKGVL